MHENLSTFTPLSALRVLNTQATRASFLSSLFSPLLVRHSAGPQNLDALLQLTQEINATLAPFGIFKTVNVRLETAQSLLAKEGSVDVVVDVKEAPRLSIKSGTEVGQAEGNAVSRVLIPTDPSVAAAKPRSQGHDAHSRATIRVPSTSPPTFATCLEALRRLHSQPRSEPRLARPSR